MPGTKTNEREGTRAVLRHFHMSASKARQVLDLIRGEQVDRAAELLATTEREAAEVIGKVLASAVANATHNDGLPEEELYVSACYADEGATMKRWRPRARGRATRIRKRTCHITVIVSRMDDERLERNRTKAAASGASRSRRVSESRRRADLQSRASKRQAEAAATAAADAAAEEAEEAATDVAVEAAEDVEVEAAEATAEVEEAPEAAAEEAPEAPEAEEEKN